MEEITEMIEAAPHGTELQAAVLHVLDGRKRTITYSEQTLDLEDEMIEKYVMRYIRKCRNDMRTKQGTFRGGSLFEKEMKRYFLREEDLPSFSAAVSAPLARYFEEEESRSFEVLFADFRTDDVPFIAVVLLQEADTMTYVTDTSGGRIRNTISFGHTALPSFTKPVSSFAIVNMLNGEILFADEEKWLEGREVIREILLDADAGLSRRETLTAIREIACETAEECDENPTLILSRVKSYISETAQDGIPLDPAQLASEVFDTSPQMARVFLKKAEEKELPKETELPRASVSASMRKQKITTDTGIEITFPVEYAAGSGFIEFIRKDDGTITIEIRNVGKVTNRM